MMMAWLLAGLGLVILVLAGDALVRGAVNLSLRIGIPALIVSLTIVAFGTSAPELIISVNAVLDGKPGLALGNVVGSNTANALIVMGLPALISRMHTSQLDTRRSYAVMMAASVFFVAMAFRGTIDRIAGIAFLAVLALTLCDQFLAARRHMADARATEEEVEVEGADPDMPGHKIAIYLVLGLIGLPFGADVLVDNASLIAAEFGVSDAVIGLTLVALGTSLPELATTVMAAIRGQADVAMGNVIGSNLFNLMAILGVTSVIRPIPVSEQFLSFDLWVMLAASLILAPFVFLKQDLGRRWGALLILLYLVYVVVVLM